jgi:ABC-2 type transport system permease protein
MRILSKTNKAILSEMIRADFKLRYQGSVLGYVWSLLRPLMLSFILYIVFAKFLGVKGDIRHYVSYLLLGIMCWTFFMEVTTGAVSAVVAKGDLIRKIWIPRYLTVLSSSASAIINFGLNMVVLIGIMLLTGVEINVKYIVFVPLLLVQLYMFGLGIAFFLSAAYVKYRDISFIWELSAQMLFYLTPIIYPMSLVLEKYEVGKYLLLNPAAQIIQDLRYILVTPQSQTAWQLLGGLAVVPVLLTVTTMLASVMYFRSQAKTFAENV